MLVLRAITMRERFMARAVIVAIVASWAVAACGAEPPADCPLPIEGATVVAEERFADSVVRFVASNEGEGPEDRAIRLLRTRPGAGCATDTLDTYGEEGGPPTLEATFTHTVQGEPNLFAIVSWPLLHAGLGLDGRLYTVYAYREMDGALVRNDVVMKNQELYGGVEGTVEGEESTFEGKDKQGVIAMLERLGLE